MGLIKRDTRSLDYSSYGNSCIDRGYNGYRMLFTSPKDPKYLYRGF